jgi:hypothetical protein
MEQKGLKRVMGGVFEFGVARESKTAAFRAAVIF